MRIAFLTVGDTARLTGGYLYHREVFARLQARGVRVDEVVASAAGLAEQLAAAPAFAARFDPLPYDALVVDALARAVCAPALDAWRALRPVVAMVHELPSVAGGAPDAAEAAREAPLLRAGRLVAVSDDGARILTARGVPAKRIVVASGGFDRLAPHAPTPPRPHSLTVLCVAQWIARKGVLELAQAWAEAARPGWLLELAGEPDVDAAYAAAVRAALAQAPAGSVAVRGRLSDAELAAAYARAALFAMPSRYEGYGIAYAEALAHGLPVVACAVGPVPALVGPAAGILTPPGDVPALGAALARLMDDPTLRASMGTAARARAAALPTWDDCAARFLGAVQAAIAEHKRTT
jgi:glycosyltransferase involved in cell wall biosynthesis